VTPQFALGASALLHGLMFWIVFEDYRSFDLLPIAAGIGVAAGLLAVGFVVIRRRDLRVGALVTALTAGGLALVGWGNCLWFVATTTTWETRLPNPVAVFFPALAPIIFLVAALIPGPPHRA